MDNKSAITVKEIKDLLNIDLNWEISFLDVKNSKVNKYKRIKLNNPKHLELKNKVEQIEFKTLESKNFIYVLSNECNIEDFKKSLLISLINKYNVENVQEIVYWLSNRVVFVGYKARKNLDK